MTPASSAFLQYHCHPAQAQHVEVPVQSASHRSALSSMKAIGQRVMAVGRNGWQSFSKRGEPASLAAGNSAEGSLRLEVQLKQADVQAITTSFRQERGFQSTGSSGLRLHLRSDFEVVRSGLQLSRWQAWFLLGDPRMLEKVLLLMGASHSKHAYLPGVRTAIGGSVSYTCLMPSAPQPSCCGTAAAQQLRSTDQSGNPQTSRAQDAELNAASSTRPAHSMYAASANVCSHQQGQWTSSFKATRTQPCRLPQRISSVLASSAQRTRTAVDRTAGAVRARLPAAQAPTHSKPPCNSTATQTCLCWASQATALPSEGQSNPRLATAYSSMLIKQSRPEQCPGDISAAVVSLG